MLHIKHYIYKQRFFQVKEMQLDAIKNIKLEIEMNILPWKKQPQSFVKLLYNKLNIQEQIMNC